MPTSGSNPAEPTHTHWHTPAFPLQYLFKRSSGQLGGVSGVARLPVHAPLFLLGDRSPHVEKITLHDLIGFQNITPAEAICLILYVAIPTIWVGMVNPSVVGYTFFTFAPTAYLIAVYRSASKRDDYNEP